jgi:signal recognition particle GTPase
MPPVPSGVSPIRCSRTEPEWPRAARIATGSGTTVQEINALLTQFTQMQKIAPRR